MARGDEVKSKNSNVKTSAIHNMVEALIKGESELAAEELHNYLQIKTREIIMGEASCAEGEESDADKEDEKDDESDDKDDEKDDESDDKDDEKDDESDDKDDESESDDE